MMVLRVIRSASTQSFGASRRRLRPSTSLRRDTLPGTTGHALPLEPLMFSRTFTRPPNAALVQTVKEIAALVPDFQRTYIYSHEHQMFGRAVAYAEFKAPQHRDALNAAGVKVSKLVTADVSRRLVRKPSRVQALVSLHSSMRQSIRELFEITAEDRNRIKSIWTSKERANLELVLMAYSNQVERRISRVSRLCKLATLGLTSGITYAWWQ